MRSNSHLGPSWRQRGRLGPPNQPWRSKFEGFSLIFESILHQFLIRIPFHFRLSIVSFSIQNMSSNFQFRHTHTHTYAYTYTCKYTYTYTYTCTYTYTYKYTYIQSLLQFPIAGNGTVAALRAQRTGIRRPLPKAGAMAC